MIGVLIVLKRHPAMEWDIGQRIEELFAVTLAPLQRSTGHNDEHVQVAIMRLQVQLLELAADALIGRARNLRWSRTEGRSHPLAQFLPDPATSADE